MSAKMDCSRRQLVAGLLGYCGTTVLQRRKLAAQTPAQNPRRLDLHHHFGTPAWIRLTNERKSQGYQVWQPYTPAKAIEDMEKGGVATSLLSVTTPGIWFGDKAETRRWARELNDYGARLVSDHKGRFGLF